MTFTSFRVEGHGKVPYGSTTYVHDVSVVFFGGTNGISTDDRTNITAQVFNCNGTLVRTIVIGTITGDYKILVEWDLKDSLGEYVPAGIYKMAIGWNEIGIVSQVNATLYFDIDTPNANGSYTGFTQVDQDYTGVGGLTENDGIVVTNVRVRAIDSNDNIADETLSDADGNFILYLLDGTYTINFYKWNFESKGRVFEELLYVVSDWLVVEPNDPAGDPKF